MKLRKILQFLALAAVAAAIFLMKPESLEQAVVDVTDGEKAEVADQVQKPEPEMAVPIAPADAPAKATPAAEPAAVFTKEIPGDPGGPPMVPALPLQKGELPWEKRINDVLDNPATKDSDKARLLFEMLPTLPVEGRQTAAEYAVQRLDDADYRFAQGIVTNPATYPPALSVLWADLMGRPEAISLPMLLQVARNPSHPYAESARENLDLLLGSNFGTDWPRWEQAIREKLAKPANEPKR